VQNRKRKATAEAATRITVAERGQTTTPVGAVAPVAGVVDAELGKIAMDRGGQPILDDLGKRLARQLSPVIAPVEPVACIAFTSSKACPT
jgi:hypothetical protein